MYIVCVTCIVGNGAVFVNGFVGNSIIFVTFAGNSIICVALLARNYTIFLVYLSFYIDKHFFLQAVRSNIPIAAVAVYLNLKS